MKWLAKARTHPINHTFQKDELSSNSYDKTVNVKVKAVRPPSGSLHRPDLSHRSYSDCFSQPSLLTSIRSARRIKLTARGGEEEHG